jgi:hypothetical protein
MYFASTSHQLRTLTNEKIFTPALQAALRGRSRAQAIKHLFIALA